MTAIGKGLSMSLAVAIVIASQTAVAQQPVSAREKAAATAVAKFMEEARTQNGLPGLRRIDDRHLREDACKRATKGDKSSGHSTGIGPPEKVGMLSVFWYSTLDPSRPPPELLEWAKGPGPRYEQPYRFAVGVCFVSAAEHSQERYWIDVGVYMSAIKSILNLPTWD
jgi:hypothetical protein